jgi:hypothetical protein
MTGFPLLFAVIACNGCGNQELAKELLSDNSPDLLRSKGRSELDQIAEAAP